MQESTKLTHGGIRKGAGPKRKFDKLERRTVTLMPEQVEILEKLGNGNLSLGIRKVLEMNTQPHVITRTWLAAWIDTNRPDLGLHETSDTKGFYKLDAGPAHSFRGCGKTWKQVAAELEAIQLPDA